MPIQAHKRYPTAVTDAARKLDKLVSKFQEAEGYAEKLRADPVYAVEFVAEDGWHVKNKYLAKAIKAHWAELLNHALSMANEERNKAKAKILKEWPAIEQARPDFFDYITANISTIPKFSYYQETIAMILKKGASDENPS